MSNNNYNGGDARSGHGQSGSRYGGNSSSSYSGRYNNNNNNNYRDNNSNGGGHGNRSYGRNSDRGSYGGGGGHAGGGGAGGGGRKAIKDMRRRKQNEAVAAKSKQETDYYWSCVQRGFVRSKRPRDAASLFGEAVRNEGIDFGKYDDIKVDCSLKELVPLESFEQVADKLGKQISENINSMNYRVPTPIQKYAMPAGFEGHDLMACAQTGSGKTAAFLIPSISSLLNRTDLPKPDPADGVARPLLAVLAPTRELAAQIFVEAEKLTFGIGDWVAVCVYGGVPAKPQLNDLAKTRCLKQIVVATPGRLIDFIDRGVMSLREVRFLILDEADRMLDMGFEPQVRQIVEQRDMPRAGERQTFMFSATFPGPIQKLATDFLRQDYVWIAVGRVGRTTESITQKLVLATSDKMQKLKLLREALNETDGRTVVFVGMKRTASSIRYQLSRYYRIEAVELHGDRTQQQREEALERFKNGTAKVLIATDVASRGLDINDVEHVVNMDLPTSSSDFQDYVHRIGRTGRAGNRGLATSFFVPGFEPKKGNGKIAGDLLRLMQEANQEIPQWFLDLPEVKSASSRSVARNGGKRSSEAPQQHFRKNNHSQKQNRPRKFNGPPPKKPRTSSFSKSNAQTRS